MLGRRGAMVIISNGFCKFHLAVAAAELHRRGLLSLLITGAYPTGFVRRLLNGSGLARNRKLGRLLARGEDIPHSRLRALWVPELFHQIAGKARHRPPFQKIGASLDAHSLRWYGRQATNPVEQAQSEAQLYHYRAGFGHESVRAARKLGMVTLCDHSIVHPALLSFLVENQGRMPLPGTGSPMDLLWSDILEDIKQADAVLVNSAFVKETFLHQGWDPARIHVIYWGVDDQFLNDVPPRTDCFALRSGELNLLFAGSLGRRKGAEVLLSALERIGDMPWHLDVAGTISPEIKDRYSGFLRHRRVTLLGTLSRAELARRMATAEVFVFPSLVEGSARVVFEALAYGCYIITTPNSGSIVEDGVHGAVVPPGDVDALEGVIRQAIARRGELAQIGYRNAALVRSRYRQWDYGEALAALYEKLLCEQKEPG